MSGLMRRILARSTIGIARHWTKQPGECVRFIKCNLENLTLLLTVYYSLHTVDYSGNVDKPGTNHTIKLWMYLFGFFKDASVFLGNFPITFNKTLKIMTLLNMVI